jgi:hypothetical protein
MSLHRNAEKPGEAAIRWTAEAADLTLEQVRAALDYYGAHPVEVDGRRNQPRGLAQA